MANTGAGKVGKSGEKGGASDTINFIYSSAVEAAVQQLDKDNNCVIPVMELSPQTKTRNKKAPEPEVKKPMQKFEVYKLDEIYQDLCQVRELSTPRTPQASTTVCEKPKPTVASNHTLPHGGSSANGPPPVEQDNNSKTEIVPKEEKAAPEEGKKGERDRDDHIGNKAGHVAKGT